MAELGELCLWAAIPVSALAAVMSLVGAVRGRGDLAAIGARAMDAATVLTLLAVVGLAEATLGVQLRYEFVARYSSFGSPPGWRLAALWTGAAGGALVLTALVSAAGAVSGRLERTRGSVARTGALAVLVLAGLIMVIVRARPYLQMPTPPLMGGGLPLAVRDPVWQVQLLFLYVACACAAFTFAGVIGRQVAGSWSGGRAERGAAAAAATLTGAAAVAAAWRAYALTGWMFDTTGTLMVLAPSAAFLVAVAYLHAPGGLAVPGWAVRWRQTMGVAVFPASLGAMAAMLVAGGGPPDARTWAGGLVLGIIAGALAGLGGAGWWTSALDRVPGFGAQAFLGSFVAVVLAGLGAVIALADAPALDALGWGLLLFIAAAMAAWAAARPVPGAWTAWPFALAGAALIGLVVYWAGGWRSPALVLSAALLGGLTLGSVAELTRLQAARRAVRGGGLAARPAARSVARARERRRGGSILAHLGFGCVVVGLAAGPLSEAAMQRIVPGDTLAIGPPGSATAAVTYLGLSRYRVDDVTRTVASFRRARRDGSSDLLTAEMTYDRRGGTEVRRPAIVRGALRDLIVGIVERGEGEEITGRIAVRPMSSLVWAGCALIAAGMTLAGRTGRLEDDDVVERWEARG